jgi:hypothetical protein
MTASATRIALYDTLLGAKMTAAIRVSILCTFGALLLVVNREIRAQASPFETQWREACAAAGRPEIGRIGFDEEKSREDPQFVERTEEGRVYKYPLIKVTYASSNKLSELIMKDNTVGNIYPGALLWSGPLAGGRVHSLPTLPGRPPVRTALSGATVARDAGA